MTGRMARLAARAAQWDRLLDVLERADSRRPDLLRVLTYHRVTDHSSFARQMEHLATHYNVTPLSALLDAVAHRVALPPRSVMITFDDGYREVADVAWPILRQLDLPAVLFVPTAYPEGPQRTYWWDRLEQALADTPRRDAVDTPIGRLPLARATDRARACSRLKRHLATLHHDDAGRHAEAIRRSLDAPTGTVPEVLGWDDLRRLAREGLAIGAHSRTHPIMSRLSPDAVRQEILGAQEDLQRELGESSPSFCYPNGRYNPTVLDALREAGVTVAFTTRRGTNDLRTADPLLLRRINISRSAGLPVLRARLVHSCVYFNRVRWLFDPQTALRGHAEHRAEDRRNRDSLKSRFLYRSLDAVVTAPLRPPRRFTAHLRSVLNVRSSNYDRVGSLVNMVDAIIPGTARRAGSIICRPVKLPFPADRIEPLAFGSGATVFLIQDGDRRRVLKIYRKSLGAGPQRLASLIEMYRAKYETIRSWYDGVTELVWPAEFMTLPGPVLGRPAIACVQDYIDGEMTDFFEGFSNGDLATVLRSSETLRRQFLHFAERTLDVARSQRRCPDFLGLNNLTIVGDGHGRRLRLIDYGSVGLEGCGDRTPEVRERITGCLERIRSLAELCANECGRTGVEN